jgi:hypothetical protein
MKAVKVSGVFAAVLGIVLLGGCGGSGGGSDSGALTVGLTDATVDSLAELRIKVTGIEIKPANGPSTVHEVSLTDCTGLPGETPDCNPIDLLSLRDGIVLTVIEGLPLEPGRYQWLRLQVDSSESYVVEDTGGMEVIDVRVPSATGLQLSPGFTILAGQTTELVLDWETRKGVTNPVGQEGYLLKPTLHIIDMADYGTLSGSVADTLMGGTCSDVAVVYVFEGDLVSAAPADDKDANLDDIDNNPPDPLVTATVQGRDDGSFGYRVAYLPTGTYSVALACQNDTPASTEALDDADEPIDFIDPQVAEIATDATTVVNF